MMHHFFWYPFFWLHFTVGSAVNGNFAMQAVRCWTSMLPSEICVGESDTWMQEHVWHGAGDGITRMHNEWTNMSAQIHQAIPSPSVVKLHHHTQVHTCHLRQCFRRLTRTRTHVGSKEHPQRTRDHPCPAEPGS